MDPLPYEGLVPTLPGRYYTSEEVFGNEVELIFTSSWTCLGRSETVTEAGQFQVHQLYDESILVVRGKDARLRAFHNMCRHRGARLCLESAGTFRKSVRCMYHGWSYDLDGRLKAAPNLVDMPELDKQQYGLQTVGVEEWLGYIWVNLHREAPPLGETALPRIAAVLGSAEKLQRYHVDQLQRTTTIEYEVSANWKIITENFMECYHCASLHPQLIAVLPQFASGYGTMVGDTRGAGFAEGTGYSLSGKAAGPMLPGLRPTDNQLHAVVVYPTAFFVLTPDHVAVYRLSPISAGRTKLAVDTLFAPEHVQRTDFDPDDTVSLRDITVRQDIEAVERCQLGMRSVAYQGVLVPAEHAIIDFYRYLLGSLREPIPPEYEDR